MDEWNEARRQLVDQGKRVRIKPSDSQQKMDPTFWQKLPAEGYDIYQGLADRPPDTEEYTQQWTEFRLCKDDSGAYVCRELTFRVHENVPI